MFGDEAAEEELGAGAVEIEDGDEHVADPVDRRAHRIDFQHQHAADELKQQSRADEPPGNRRGGFR